MKAAMQYCRTCGVLALLPEGLADLRTAEAAANTPKKKGAKT